MKTREAQVGKATIRMAETKTGFGGIVLLEGVSPVRLQDQHSERLWERLHQEAARLNPNFVGYDGARTRFLRLFPDGFSSKKYLGQGKLGERDYKLKAKRQLDESLPLNRAHEAKGAGEVVLKVFQATNLLFPNEKMRLAEALRGPHADRFVQGAAEFALGDRTRGIAAMAQALRAHGADKWTTVTYLPFLWRPDAHMFLKPEVTRKFASCVGHRFQHQYSPELDERVYSGLLDLVSEARAKLEDLTPRDNIDIQSFIWVVGAYSIKDEQALLDEATNI
ncbi:MAG: hypothetical protein JO001_18765 [Alphaproteobacteria bacterium]|nr:hypothetical protein [Alphaproteobacteria bacterium]